jgi:hypothetical protein
MGAIQVDATRYTGRADGRSWEHFRIGVGRFVWAGQ